MTAIACAGIVCGRWRRKSLQATPADYRNPRLPAFPGRRAARRVFGVARG
jgi:hypothetical protein